LPTKRGFDYYFGIPFSNNMANAYGLPPLPLMRGDKVIEENPKLALLTQRYTEEAVNFIKANKDICDNQMTDSGAKANRGEVMRASTPGLYLFPGRCARSGADKRRKCL
jgi:hypothetical protein